MNRATKTCHSGPLVALPRRGSRAVGCTYAIARPELVSRRTALGTGLSLLSGVVGTVASPWPSFADGPESQIAQYMDAVDGWRIDVPANWTQGEGSLGNKKQDRFSNAAGMQRVVGWVSPTSQTTSLAVTVKTPGADYTGLGSFGRVDDWAENLIATIDRSFMARAKFGGKDAAPIVTANLVGAKEIGSGDGKKYIVEYVTAKTGEPTRHVFTAVCFGESGKLRKFYTVTASCVEEDYTSVGEGLRKSVSSFQP